MVKFGSSFGIRWYGFSYLLAFFCGFLLLRWLAQRRYCALPPDKVGDFILAAALGVVVGGRLGYVLFYRPGQLFVDPLFVFRIWDGGMSSHGGMIGLTLAVFLYGRRHHVPWLSLADNIAVVAPVGLFLGRCANFINGELYGRAATVAWAMQFPKEALDLGALSWLARRNARGIPIRATLVQFAIANLLIFVATFQKVVNYVQFHLHAFLCSDSPRRLRLALAASGTTTALFRLGLPHHSGVFPCGQRLDALAPAQKIPQRASHHSGGWRPPCFGSFYTTSRRRRRLTRRF